MGKHSRDLQKRNVFPVVLTLAALAGLAVFSLRYVPAVLRARLGRQAGPNVADEHRAPEPATASHDRRYRVGDVLVYALAHEAAIDATDGGRFYQLAASGDWTLHVLSLEHGETLLAVSLRNAQLKSTNGRPGQDEEYRRVERALSEPTFVSLNARGAVVALRVDPSMPRAATDLLRSVIALSQNVATDGVGDADGHWTTTEADATGKYLAQYQKLADHTGVSKRKLSYTEVQAGVDPGASQLQVEVLASEGTLALDDRGLVEKSHVRDVVRSHMQLVPEMTATTMLALTRKSLAQDMAAVSALRDRAAKLQAVALYDTPPSNDEQLAIDRAKVAGRSLGDFLHALAEVPKSEKESEDQRNRRRRLFIEFAALLRLDDKAVDQVMARILSGEEEESGESFRGSPASWFALTTTRVSGLARPSECDVRRAPRACPACA